MLYALGARCGELLRLEWPDVEMPDGSFRFGIPRMETTVQFR